MQRIFTLGQQRDFNQLIILLSPLHIHSLWGMQIWIGRLQYLLQRSLEDGNPIEYRGHDHFTTLEFIAAVASIWVDIPQHSTKQFECILAKMDNTSVDGWLKNSNFPDSIHPSDLSICLSIARKLTSILMTSETCLFSQWFPGTPTPSLMISHEIYTRLTFNCVLFSFLYFPNIHQMV